MNPIYNAAISLYALGARIGALRSAKIRKMIDGQNATLEILRHFPDGFDVWFHVASLGEFEQARPMIERLRRERPDFKILLSFFSPSGYEVRKHYDQVDCVVYLPFDTPGRVRSFLDAARPRLAIFVKYEFWGNYLAQLRERSIPTYIISAIFRPGQRFFSWYGGMFRDMLRCYDHLFVQDERSLRLLKNIGIENVTVAGDTRFDRVTDVLRSGTEFPKIAQWKGDSPLLIAGSSWQPDEQCYIPYLNSHPTLKAIIAPHEFDEERLQQLESAIDGSTVRFSRLLSGAESLSTQVKTIIVDCFGKLSSLYRYGTIAIIGGGFGAGIHNINEAAVFGQPVIFGPNHNKFKEASDLINCGGGFEYTSRSDFERIADSLLKNPENLTLSGAAAAGYIKSNLGATDKIFNHIFPSK